MIPQLKRHAQSARVRARGSVQRARRGYSDSDAWNLDGHLARVIVGGVGTIRERGLGHPGSLTPEEWDEILGKIVAGFDAYIETDGFVFMDEEAEAKYNEAFDLLHKWFGHLWD